MQNSIFILILVTLFNITTQAQLNQSSHENDHSEEQEESTFVKPDGNFSVHRLFIVNDNDEILITDDWFTPSFIHSERQYLTEALDSLATAYGVTIEEPQLRALLSYKYEYHDDATIRCFYVAKYVCGTPKTPEGMTNARWLPIKEVAKRNHVRSIGDGILKIFENPNVVWGGSFMIWHEGELHGSNVVEDFYPLFEAK